MLFGVLAVVFFVCFLFLLFWAFMGWLEDRDWLKTGILVAIATVCWLFGWWFQSHGIVSTQHVGVSRSTFSQELAGPLPPGVVKKPFFGKVYEYPASSSYERCEQYTPAIKGSYGITLDLCFYYDTGNTDWLREINRTGSLDADYIMSVWRNSIVGSVAKSVKDYMPEELSDERPGVEQAIFANVAPWFEERGVPLVCVSFKNWDFTSEEVAKSFDESIVSQRRITEQAALFEAAKISREREEYEAETARIVAERQKETLELLGLEGDAAVQYLWIRAMTESNIKPDILVLGASVPVAVSP